MTIGGTATDAVIIRNNAAATVGFQLGAPASRLVMQVQGDCLDSCSTTWMLFMGNFGPNARYDNLITGGTVSGHLSQGAMVADGQFAPGDYFLALSMDAGSIALHSSNNPQVQGNGMGHIGLFWADTPGHVAGFREHRIIPGAGVLMTVSAQ